MNTTELTFNKNKYFSGLTYFLELTQFWENMGSFSDNVVESTQLENNISNQFFNYQIAQ